MMAGKRNAILVAIVKNGIVAKSSRQTLLICDNTAIHEQFSYFEDGIRVVMSGFLNIDTTMRRGYNHWAIMSSVHQDSEVGLLLEGDTLVDQNLGRKSYEFEALSCDISSNDRRNAIFLSLANRQN